MKTSEQLKPYRSKRNFAVTTEPSEGGQENEVTRSFVIQKHWATRLHYDLRLELEGTMKSWAVPKGPSLDPKQKRMAIHVEDHPIAYNTFEGVIPEKQYGAGKVIIWDKGTWQPVNDPYQGYKDGNLKFELHGRKLNGKWVLVRIKGKSDKQEPWLLIKEKDNTSRPAEEFSVVDALPDSVAHLKTPARAGHKNSVEKSKQQSTAAEKPTSVTQAMTEAKAVSPAKASLPLTLKPHLATLVVKPPGNSEDWIYEIKFDGYRMLTRIDAKSIRLFTRNGNDWSAKLPALKNALQELNLKPSWLDGEIVVLNDRGLPDFQALQGAFDRTAKINNHDIVYYIFDVPYYDGLDLRAAPLIQRKQFLGALLENSASSLIRFSENFDVPQQDVLQAACHLGLEGVIGKRKSSSYASRRSADWIKLKCSQRQEFVIGGYTDPQGSRVGIGALLLGIHDADGKLRYAGKVGAGFNDKTLANIKQKLQALRRSTTPFAEKTAAKKTSIDRTAHWVAPTLIAEVSFAEWTSAGHIRHSVFHGLRADKKASEIISQRNYSRETADHA